MLISLSPNDINEQKNLFIADKHSKIPVLYPNAWVIFFSLCAMSSHRFRRYTKNTGETVFLVAFFYQNQVIIINCRTARLE